MSVTVDFMFIATFLYLMLYIRLQYFIAPTKYFFCFIFKDFPWEVTLLKNEQQIISIAHEFAYFVKNQKLCFSMEVTQYHVQLAMQSWISLKMRTFNSMPLRLVITWRTSCYNFKPSTGLLEKWGKCWFLDHQSVVSPYPISPQVSLCGLRRVEREETFKVGFRYCAKWHLRFSCPDLIVIQLQLVLMS